MHRHYHDTQINNIKIKITLNKKFMSILRFDFLKDAQNIAIGPAKLHFKFYLKLKRIYFVFFIDSLTIREK